jgi:hypothetical protein
MGECSMVGWINDFLLLVTAVIVAFYTRETYRLRKETQRQVEETQRQTELQNRPFLIIECPRAGLDGEILIRNAGKGVAINVSMVTAVIGNDTRVEHVGLMHLQPGEARAPSLRVILARIRNHRTAQRKHGPATGHLPRHH